MADALKLLALSRTLVPNAVNSWLDQHPEATTTVEDGSITQAKLASALSSKIDEIDQHSEEIANITTATDSDIGKALSPKTVTNGAVTEWQYKVIGSGGSGGVSDVQVNGTSVTDGDGVADIPIASASDLGVAKADPDYGVGVFTLASDTYKNKLYCNKATDAQIKAGVSSYRPIVPSNANSAAFYGLATAAGDTTQKASANAVGTYTDDAKSAIQTMLGVNPALELINEVTYDSDVMNQDITTDSDGNAFQLDAMFVIVTAPAGAASPMNGRIYYSKNGVDASSGFRLNNFSHASYAVKSIVQVGLLSHGMPCADAYSIIFSAFTKYDALVEISDGLFSADYIHGFNLRDATIPAGTNVTIYGHRI